MLAYTAVTIFVDCWSSRLLARGLVGVVVRAETALNYYCSVGDQLLILELASNFYMVIGFGPSTWL